MRLIRCSRCLILFLGLAVNLTQGWSQPSSKPLDELDRLPNWFPLYRPVASQFNPILPDRPHSYRTLADLVRQVKAGSKVEALTIDNTILADGHLEQLRQLTQVRVLHITVSGEQPQAVDSLFQYSQDWPVLERLVLTVNPPYRTVGKPNQWLRLPTTMYRFPKVHDVQLNGSGIQWEASLAALVGLKTLRQLSLSSWGWQSSTEQPIQFVALPQLVGLKLIGQGFRLTSGTFAKLNQLKEVKLVDVRADTTTFLRTIHELPNLEALIIENVRSIKQLPLAGLKKLKTLELLNNPDLIVGPTTFAGSPTLERLVIRMSLASDLSTLCSLPHLRTLIVGGQRKSAEVPACIGQLNQLTELRLEYMTLSQLPAEIGSLRQLKKLSLVNCLLDSLPSSIGQLTQLDELTLEGNKLRQLPDIKLLTALTELNVTANQLTTLSDNIGLLTKLTKLNLATNKLTQLPSTLSKLADMRLLTLNGNQLTQLPEDIGKLRKLKSLSVHDNALVKLPNSLDQLDSLQGLFISNNRLQRLPTSLAKLKRLTGLDIGKNELTALPDNIGELKSLNFLFIGANPLTELPATFGQLENLRTLTISGTKLRFVPENIGSLTNLVDVTLSNNELITLPNSIGGWQNVTSLSLDQNRLEGLPNGIGRLTKLTNLHISGKEKAVEGAVGGLQQLPDSIVYCSQLQQLTLDRQPQLDVADVMAKAARLTKLIQLRITESNVSRLPDISWKDVNWQTLILQQNLLTELPVAILEAPALRSVCVSQNRLPEALNQNFYDKVALQVSLVETGALPRERLPKPSRSVAVAYQHLSMVKARERDWEGTLTDLDKAIDYAPDTTKATMYGQRASFLFFRRQYNEALGDYDKAIEYGPWLWKDKRNDSLTTKRMLTSFWQQKAAVLGIKGQNEGALSALNQAVSLLPGMDNTGLSGLVYTELGRYLALKDKTTEADSSYRKAIQAYEKLSYAEPGTKLTIVELSLLTGQYEHAQKALVEIGPLNNGFDVVKEYLENCLMVMKGERDGTQTRDRLAAYLSKHPTKVYGWSFDLFDNWLNKAKLAPEKITALRQLTDATKERLVKPAQN